MFDQEFNYFIAHQEELVKKYSNKTLILKGEEVIGAFDSPLHAYIFAKDKYAPGSYMLQRCISGTDAYTVSIATIGLVS